MEKNQKEFQAVSATCPVRSNKGDCNIQIIDSHQYTDGYGGSKTEFVYESCTMELCPVYHFVRNLKNL